MMCMVLNSFEEDYFIQFKPNKYSISFTGNLNGTDASKIKWIRAKNLYHDPKMLKHGHSKSDVNQGEVYILTSQINFHH